MTLALTPLLEGAIAVLSQRSAAEQDLAAELLMGFLKARAADHELPPAQLAEVDAALGEAERGEFVSEVEVEAMWRRFKR